MCLETLRGEALLRASDLFRASVGADLDVVGLHPQNVLMDQDGTIAELLQLVRGVVRPSLVFERADLEEQCRGPLGSTISFEWHGSAVRLKSRLGRGNRLRGRS